MGEGGSSSGSDSAPSEDNLPPQDLIKNLPVADKTLKQKIKQIEKEKLKEAAESKKKLEQAKKAENVSPMKRYPEEPKQKRVASPIKEPQPRQPGFQNLRPV